MSTQTSLPRWTPGPWHWHKMSDYAILVNGPIEPDGESPSGVQVHSDGSACGEYGPDIDVDGPDGLLIAASPDFAAACTGRHYPDVDRLTWLSALISRFLEINVDVYDADPAAEATMLSECEGLLADLRAAMDKANGGAS